MTSPPDNLGHPSRWLQLTDQQDQFIKRILLEEADHVGPSVIRVVQALWADAVVEAARDVYRLLRLTRQYDAQRLEAACRRAAFYRQHSSSFVVEWILRERYDQLPLTPCTDIRGHFPFAFDRERTD